MKGATCLVVANCRLARLRTSSPSSSRLILHHQPHASSTQRDYSASKSPYHVSAFTAQLPSSSSRSHNQPSNTSYRSKHTSSYSQAPHTVQIRSSSTSPTWSQAIAHAEGLVHPAGGSVINPRELLGKDLAIITDNIRKLLGSGHPVLKTISNYYFSQQGKQFRPLIVLLMSMATSIAPKVLTAGNSTSNNTSLYSTSSSMTEDELINTQISRGDGVTFSPHTTTSTPGITPSQRRLAEITEMIHTASLLHDDVIDDADIRRNRPTANAAYGNKMAILAGDFLLARASVALARLRDTEVVELLATVISNLVEGEFMQLRNSQLDKTNGETLTKFDYYMEKTYMKTASLIAKSCRAAAVLGRCAPEIQDASYSYGKNLGLAFQLVDDLLDFTVSAQGLGKPANADLKLGLATAPVLYAADEFQELWPLIERKFDQAGDAELAYKLVHQSTGITKTRELAASYCQAAVDAISTLPQSTAQLCLVQLTQAVLTRKR
ncbi:hypothetical protein SmJEL517_g05701 [Synchytrium microbalum]|uniref:Uncharacterized protein n=1 Tax=Synchytrium microbalum TaxID=1806994 RepID=A0A507BYN0_9FUNG|nr:uncharacterized protein SmJEL517_g05701 [Synchytrium microbalum]TPX30836.1 hypothetical protein SmJEL517_g05701 [Synchytrium microbalum]